MQRHWKSCLCASKVDNEPGQVTMETSAFLFTHLTKTQKRSMCCRRIPHSNARQQPSVRSPLGNGIPVKFMVGVATLLSVHIVTRMGRWVGRVSMLSCMGCGKRRDFCPCGLWDTLSIQDLCVGPSRCRPPAGKCLHELETRAVTGTCYLVHICGSGH